MLHELRAAVVAVLRVALAVTRADLRVFLIEIEGFEHLARREHPEGLLRKTVEAVHQAAAVHVATEVIEAREQALAVVEAVERDAVEDHVVLARAGRAEGRVTHAEEAGLARVRPTHLAHLRREAEERRDGRVGRALQLREHGAERGPAAGRLVAREPPRLALEGVVVVNRADHRADEDELVHDGSGAREQLADLDAGDVRRDGFQLAANLARRVHLQVEHILMRRAAGQEDVDDGLVRFADARLRLDAQQVREGKPAEAQRPDAQEVAPRLAIAEGACGFSEQGQHGCKLTPLATKASGDSFRGISVNFPPRAVRPTPSRANNFPVAARPSVPIFVLQRSAPIARGYGTRRTN